MPEKMTGGGPVSTIGTSRATKAKRQVTFKSSGWYESAMRTIAIKNEPPPSPPRAKLRRRGAVLPGVRLPRSTEQTMKGIEIRKEICLAAVLVVLAASMAIFEAQAFPISNLANQRAR
jgi:hypothetical protein